MKIYITLDYELFFGPKSGSVEKCIIEPTEALLKILDPHGIKANFFVDAGYLVALEKQKADHQKLQEDYIKVTTQIKDLASNGHGIELHVHPHWEDSYYDGEKWVFDTTRYKLSDFGEDEVLDIVTNYTNVLKRTAGKSPVAYRAGGWSAQPFSNIGKALKANGVLIDSSVYPQGYYSSHNQSFDFRNIEPYQRDYQFSKNLTKPDAKGEFLEVPISSIKVSPLFFWNFAFKKLKRSTEHNSIGDGAAVPMSKKEALRLMSSSSYSVVSIDGFKISLIHKALKNYIKKTANEGSFVVIGHPKAFTPYSLNKLRNFVDITAQQHSFVVYSR